jgi:hypothetical protein
MYMNKYPAYTLDGVKRIKGDEIYMDPVLHDQHWAWLRKKAQAVFRGESWSLTIEEWFDLWAASGLWDNRGRHKDSSAMFMIDPQKGWHVYNVEIVNRSKRLSEINSGNPRIKGRPRKNGKNIL